MHFLECYALNCGLKIDRPFIEEEPLRNPNRRLHNFSWHSFISIKSYDFWQEVIDFTKGSFPDISIVQLGTESSERKYNNTENYLGKTNFNQSAYLMKRAKLHFGIDSFPAHLASCFEIPSVVLYSHTYKEQCYPFFTKLKHLRLIQAPLNTVRPSYNNKEEALYK